MVEAIFFLIGLVMKPNRALMFATLLYLLVAGAVAIGVLPLGHVSIQWSLLVYTVEMSITGVGVLTRIVIGQRSRRNVYRWEY